MRVRMTHNIGGFRNGAPWPRKGDSIDLPDHEAADLIQVGYAEPAEETTDAPEPTAEPAPGSDAAAAALDPDPAGDGDGPATDDSSGPDILGLQLAGLDKPALIALAAKHGIEVSSRWGASRLRETIGLALARAGA